MANILLLGDITGRSCVALRMMMRELEYLGHEVLALPTALVSNTLNLGRAETLDTTDYLLRTLDTWRALGITYDIASIGYITGMAQAAALCAVADALRAQGVTVLLDPILGDGGKKYNSVTEEQVEGMRLLCAHADLITPNLTEAVLLAEQAMPAGQTLSAEAYPALLSGEGRRSVLITGCPGSRDDEGVIVGYDAKMRSDVCVRFDRVPGRHFGTGDMFSAQLMDGMCRGLPLARAAHEASEAVGELLRRAPEAALPGRIHR